MPRGGRRVGAGRKPGGKRPAVVLGMDGARHELPPAGAEPVDHPLATAPADLSVEARSCWERYAPEAIAERTLTSATAAGFRQFCQQWAFTTSVHAEIERRGAHTKDAEGLMRTYVKLAQRLDASLARFKLTAFGKAATAEKPKPAVNPWAAVGR